MTATADVIAALQSRFPQATPRPSADHPAVNVAATEAIAALAYLRDDHGFDFLVDLTAVDWGVGVSPRYTVVWHLFSTHRHNYVRVAAACPSDLEPAMPTTTVLWPGADWLERETFDMMGVVFTGHVDLRRILMWDGYPHYPLRKDFPLAGIEGALSDPEITAETGTKVIAAPMAGGPFVASQGEINLTDAEPGARDESWSEANEKPPEGI